MLCIYTSEDEHGFNWHSGIDGMLKNISPQSIVEISADGDELRGILCNIDGIPKTTAKYQRWFGDDAKFIAVALGVVA